MSEVLTLFVRGYFCTYAKVSSLRDYESAFAQSCPMVSFPFHVFMQPHWDVWWHVNLAYLTSFVKCNGNEMFGFNSVERSPPDYSLWRTASLVDSFVFPLLYKSRISGPLLQAPALQASRSLWPTRRASCGSMVPWSMSLGRTQSSSCTARWSTFTSSLKIVLMK